MKSFSSNQGCKGFFRRTIRDGTSQRYKCPEKNNCVIIHSTRNACRACRFQKCLAAGMSIEGSRIGRQSNLFKHKMIEMQRRGLIRSQLRNIIASNSNNSSNRINNSRNRITINPVNDTEGKDNVHSSDQLFFFLELSAFVESTAALRLEDKLEVQVFEQIVSIENAYINYLKVCYICIR
jgi:hypothetical protein